MARIVTVYNTERRAATVGDMSYIRWFKISEALARRGHEVDIATAEFKWRVRRPVTEMAPNLRRVPLSRVRWSDYDVVKTSFHQGFETLTRYGGHRHPFIIAKLGSVVGPEDMEGVYFYGRSRQRLFETQRKIDRRARFVTLLSPPARDLWSHCFGPRDNLLLVPGAAESELPPPGPDPYGDAPRPRCVFAGNVYTSRTQPKANRVLLSRLNDLGRRLSERGIQLFLVGSGDLRGLDRAHVTWMGSVPYSASWDYLHHADVGILVAAGPFMHNNESTKIYHYLRAGLPVVSEAGFPNDWVLHDSKHAFVVENGNMDQLADRAEQATLQSWDRARAIEYILQNHTWDARVEVYDRLISEHCA